MTYALGVNGKTFKNVTDFTFSVHGFRSIVKSITGSTVFEGFYNNKYFLMESVRDYGETSWDMIIGEFNEEEEEKLIEWITDSKQHSEDKVYQKWLRGNQ